MLAVEILLFALAAGGAIGLPGLALATLDRRLTREHVFVTVFGLGFAFNVLLFLAAYLLGVHVRRGGYLLLLALCLAILARYWLRMPGGPYLPAPESDSRLTWWVPVVLCLLTAVVRGFPMRSHLVMPGVDSIQHAQLAQNVISTGGIPGLSYHFGAQVNSVAISLLSGLQVHRVQLLLLPLMMGVLAAAVMKLAQRLTQNPHAALGAGVLVGLVSPFPAWYANWGRLPFLCGLTLFALVFAQLPDINPRRPRLNDIPPAMVLLVFGMVFTHYRTIFLLFFACLVWLALHFERADPSRLRESTKRRAGERNAWIVLAGGLLLLAGVVWFGMPIWRRLSEAPLDRYYYSLTQFRYLLSIGTTLPILAAMTGGLYLTFKRKAKGPALLGLFLAVVVALSNPHLVPFLLAGKVDVVTAISTLFILGCVLAALLLPTPSGETSIARNRRTVRFWVCLGVLAALGTWGLADVVRARIVYASDASALRWVNRTISPQAVFYSPTQVSLNGRAERIDAGAWIGYFTGRSQVPTAEELPTWEGPPELDSPEDAEEFRRFMDKEEVTHLYFGKRYETDHPRPSELVPWYTLLYNRSGIQIYRKAAEAPE